MSKYRKPIDPLLLTATGLGLLAIGFITLGTWLAGVW